ncbi:hypothetical protein [Shewanella sp. ENK2]|uniref:hypothetical protein n=1 Tax=Shewanella sp. ENK2 TaxID=2775245 RepID=UPI003747D65A
MRISHYFCVIVTSLIFCISPAASANESHMGLHGMTLFGGKDGLFASHLPMYHHPHNVQMVMQFHFADPETDHAIKQQLETMATAPEQLWTIVPKPFDLMRLSPLATDPIEQLQVDVVKGHFERGGINQFSQQSLIIDRIIMFTELSMKAGQDKAPNAQYRVITPTEDSPNQFLVKVIENRPEADHLLRVIQHDFIRTTQITVPLKGKLHPSPKDLADQLSIPLEHIIEIYLETGELQ